jgi:hypothetical protein
VGGIPFKEDPNGPGRAAAHRLEVPLRESNYDPHKKGRSGSAEMPSSHKTSRLLGVACASARAMLPCGSGAENETLSRAAGRLSYQDEPA